MLLADGFSSPMTLPAMSRVNAILVPPGLGVDARERISLRSSLQRKKQYNLLPGNNGGMLVPAPLLASAPASERGPEQRTGGDRLHLTTPPVGFTAVSLASGRESRRPHPAFFAPRGSGPLHCTCSHSLKVPCGPPPGWKLMPSRRQGSTDSHTPGPHTDGRRHRRVLLAWAQSQLRSLWALANRKAFCSRARLLFLLN